MRTIDLTDAASGCGAEGLRTAALIGGEWLMGSSRFPVVDPSTETVLAEVADCTIEQGIMAVDAAERAATDWRRRAPRERSVLLLRCYQLMMERRETFARIVALENGKAIADARSEISYAAEFFRWYAEEAVRIGGEIGTAPSGANRIVVEHQPIGISILVTPWNFPAAMATRKIAPALAAGCTCVLKPAANTPLTALAIAELMQQAGIPAGVVNVVTTRRSGAVIEALLKDSRVRKLSFTGSTAVGRTLLRAASEQIISCSMELGGNAPFVVFDDADLDSAVSGAMIAKMRNGGQACTAANRFYVQRGVYDDFVDRLSVRMSEVVVGPGTDDATGCGPLISADAVQRMAALVADAASGGAQVRTGGVPLDRKGFYFQPTVLSGPAASAAVLNTEIFGPIAPIVPFDTESEAIRMANATEYGLVAYVYSQNLTRAWRVGEEIEAGMIGVNRGLVSDPAAPFGGMKQSGIGREGGHHGLLEFCEAKYFAMER